MKISQKYLAETYPEYFQSFISRIKKTTIEVNLPELKKYYFLTYDSQSHDNPFPIVYPIQIQGDTIMGFSLFEVPPDRVSNFIDFLGEQDEFDMETINTLSSYIRKFKLSQILSINQLSPSSVINVYVQYVRMIRSLSSES